MTEFAEFSVAMTAIRNWLMARCRFGDNNAMIELSRLAPDVKAAVMSDNHTLIHYNGKQLRPSFGDNEHMRRVVGKINNPGENVLVLLMGNDVVEHYTFVIGRPH